MDAGAASEATIGSAAASCPLLVSRAPASRLGSSHVSEGDKGGERGANGSVDEVDDRGGEDEESEWEEMAF